MGRASDVEADVLNANQVLAKLVRGTECSTLGRGLTSPEGVLEGRVVDSSDFPSAVNLKGLKVAPNSAIYNTVH